MKGNGVEEHLCRSQFAQDEDAGYLKENEPHNKGTRMHKRRFPLFFQDDAFRNLHSIHRTRTDRT